jgi:tRNA threonylcarbamoyladenosine biosynthesis protein TsaB
MTTDIFFISIQATYKTLAIALFKNNECLISILNDEQRASSLLAPMLNDLLVQQGLALREMAFLAVDIGPGAFTSLRVIIATVNGIAFASKIPLVGVTSFEGLAYQGGMPYSLVLLNAFNNDVYVAYAKGKAIVTAGCVKYEALTDFLGAQATREPVVVFGNGVVAYPQVLEVLKPLFSVLMVSDLLVPSAEAIGLCGFEKWQQGERTTKLVPAYLKSQTFAIQGIKS